MGTARAQEVSRWSKHLNFFPAMKKERAKTDFELKLKVRIPPELVKWLIGLLVSGSALSAATHWIK